MLIIYYEICYLMSLLYAKLSVLNVTKIVLCLLYYFIYSLIHLHIYQKVSVVLF